MQTHVDFNPPLAILLYANACLSAYVYELWRTGETNGRHGGGLFGHFWTASRGPLVANM